MQGLHRMTNKNILEICLSPDLGGLELFTVYCHKNFKTKTSCSMMVAPTKKLDLFLTDQDKFHLSRNKLLPIIPAFKLAKFIDKHEIDIIHFHWTRDIATVVLAKILSHRKPKIIQSRHMMMTRFKDDIYHRWLYKNIDIIHAITYQVKEQLGKFIPERVRPEIEMIYIGTKEYKMDVPAIQALQEKYQLNDSFVVGIIGRIEQEKGQYLLLEAIAKLKILKIKALIVGHTMDKVYLASLKEKVKTLGIEELVIFTGFTKEVNTHIRLCDVTVLATQKETFGLVIIESMINKVPVIATNNGGPLEIIEQDVDGLFFDGSSVDLAKQLQRLYEDKTLREQLALSGYEKAKERFYSDVQLEKLYKVIYHK